MRFQVPQFIDVEDKIFGPLTFKQFIYLAGGAGLCVILWVFLPILVAVPIIAGVAALSIALAFYKVNNRPFVSFLQSLIRYQTGGKLYLWKKVPKKVKRRALETESAPSVTVPRLSQSKLKDLAWSLDVKDSIYEGQETPRG